MLFLVTFSLLFSSISAQNLSGILERYYSEDGTVTDENCLKTEVGCENCNTISICVENLKKLNIPCNMEPNVYCNAGSCMPFPDDTCNSDKSEFVCGTNEGTFPDPKDCTLYHICLGGVGFDYKCIIENTVYNPDTKSCVKKSLKHRCSSVACLQNGRSVAYPADRSIYFVCVKGEPSLLMKCPESSIFDEEVQKCQEFCSKEGPIPDLSNNKGFIECVWLIGSKYVMEHRICPQKENQIQSVFDPVKNECVLVQK